MNLIEQLTEMVKRHKFIMTLIKEIKFERQRMLKLIELEEKADDLLIEIAWLVINEINKEANL